MKARSAVLIALALFAAGVSSFYLFANTPLLVSESAPLIGGPFALTDTAGKRVTDRDFRGKLMLVFFGYTHCPDVCPTELQNLSTLLERLGSDADRLAPLFISVDGKRDTPEVLADYMKNFDARIVGLTGSEAEIASVAKVYRVYYRKVGDSEGNDYSVDHSGFVYLMDENGHYITHFPFNAAEGIILAAIRKKITADKDKNRS